MDPSTPILIPHSLPSQLRLPKELSDLPDRDMDEDWSEDDHWSENERDMLLNGPHDSGHYGASVPVNGGFFGSRGNKMAGGRRKKIKRRSLQDTLEGSNGVSSISSLANRVRYCIKLYIYNSSLQCL